MTLIQLLITLVFIGIGLYALNTMIPMDGKIRQIINVIVVIAVLLWLCEVFGLIAPIHLGAPVRINSR